MKLGTNRSLDRPRSFLLACLLSTQLARTCGIVDLRAFTGLVPHSIFLSHQCLFYNLGETYHSLIRRNRLGTSGAKIEVR